jgi:agmatine deiminase
MPAEWETHEATWIVWPHRRDDWPGKFAPIPWVYAEIVRHLHRSERVRILVDDLEAEQRAKRILSKSGVNLTQVDFFQFATDRSWIRDYGPLFVAMPDGSVGLTSWHFNGWAKYEDWQRDAAVSAQIRKALNVPGWEPHWAGRRIVLEGGSIDVNGHGLLLTTEECLLSPVQARNPGLDRADLEQLLGKYLGVQKTLWLGRGIAGDDTHGHVDDIARFVGPRTVVAAVEPDRADANFEPLKENWDRLRAMMDTEGRPLEIIALPMPEPVIFNGQRLPASHANFYIANDRVLVPTFNDPSDRKALATLAEVLPDRTVVGIHAVDLVLGLGTLHCMTQQQPRAAGGP